MSYKTYLILFIIVFIGFLQTFGYERGFIGNSDYMRVYYESKDNLKSLIETGLIIDRFSTEKGYITCYAEEKHRRVFDELGLRYSKILTSAQLYEDEIYRNQRSGYRTFADVEAELINISQEYPQWTELLNIGESVQGRGLYFLRVTSDIQSDPIKPEFHYISTMHGDEKVGTELCMEFIYYLLENYGTDTFATNLMDNIDMYIMPVMNPDGFVAHTRGNANGYDLNRNFPDFINDPNDTPAGRQVETAILMEFYHNRRGVLSANFHTGALCVNYPWDNNYNDHPEVEMIIELSLLYSMYNSPMYNSPVFENGITNGADWYVISGGMQDYSTYYHSNLQVTIELSTIKHPPASTLPQLWLDNMYSMLSYAGSVRRGAQGFILDSDTGEPVYAQYEIEGIDWIFYNDQESGFFHKILMPGSHVLSISAEGYEDKTIDNIIIGDAYSSTYDLGNIFLDPIQEEWVISFSVICQDTGLAIEEAIISINSDEYLIITDSYGTADISLPDGDYDYNANAEGFENDHGSFTVVGENKNIDIILEPVIEIPEAPSGLTAMAVSSSQIALSWTDNSDNEDGFKIERKTDIHGTWHQIAEVGENTINYNNTQLSPGTTYYYRVRAFNEAGYSNYSNEAYAITEEEDHERVSVFRFFNTQKGGHLYTISEHERDHIIDNLPEWDYEGISFEVYLIPDSNTKETYRFFNTETGIHLYTISEHERDYIIDNLQEWNYEGISFYVYEEEHPDTIPVFRFFNNKRGGHFYTISELERDYIIDNLLEWDYEGKSFYVFP